MTSSNAQQSPIVTRVPGQGTELLVHDVNANLNELDVFNPNYVQWERLYIDSLKSVRSQDQATSRIRVLRRAFNIPAGGTIPWGALTVNRVKILISNLGKPNNGIRQPANKNRNEGSEKPYSNSAINSFIAVIKGVINAGINEGSLKPESPAYRIRSAIKAVHTNDINPALRPAIPDHIIKQFLEAFLRQTGTSGARNSALFHVLVCAGLRRSEVCWLSISDYHRASRTLDFRGKGKKHRHIGLVPSACRALEKWIDDYRGPYEGAMFPRIRANDTIEYETHLQPESINYFMRQIQRHEMELPKESWFSPHQLRYSFATRAMEKGINLFELQKMLGHSNLSTTSIYTRRDNKHLDKWMSENMEL